MSQKSFQKWIFALLRSYEPKIASSRVSRLLHNGCQAQPQDELLHISQRKGNSEKGKVTTEREKMRHVFWLKIDV